MPITIDYTPGETAAALALAAGSAQGRAQRMQQQRSIDASMASQVMGQDHQMRVLERNQDFARETMGLEDRARRDNIELALKRMEMEETARGELMAAEKERGRELAESQAAQKQSALDLENQINEQYKGREKDVTYSQAINELRTTGRLTDRTASALGVTTESEKIRRENEQRAGVMDEFEPKTASERRSRRMLDQGSFDQMAPMLKRLTDGRLRSGDRDYDNVVDAQIQLKGWAKVQSDPAPLAAAIESFKEQGVSDEVLAPLSERLEEIRTQEMVVKAPVVMENAMAGFQNQAMRASAELGRPLTPIESSTILAESLERQLVSAGIDQDVFEKWLDSQEQIKAQAHQAAEQMIAQQQAAMPRPEEPTGSEQEYGVDQMMQSYPGLRVEGSKAVLPEYLMPVSPGDDLGNYIDTRTGEVRGLQEIIAPALQFELERQRTKQGAK